MAAAADYFFDRRWKADAWSFFLAAIPIERTKVNRRSAQLAADLLEEGWTLVTSPRVGDHPTAGPRPSEAGPPTWPPAPAARWCRSTSTAPATSCPRGTRRCAGRGPITFGTPLWPTEGEDARRFGGRIETAVATMANEATTDWWSARKQAAAGTTPALQGPEVAPWRRTCCWPTLPPGGTAAPKTARTATACGPAGTRPRPRRDPAAGALQQAVRRRIVGRRQPFGPEGRLLGVVERFEGVGRTIPEGPSEEQVGQDGVAGQNRTVEIRAHHPGAPGTFAPGAVTVTHPLHHLPHRRRSGTHRGDRAVVLEPGELR